MDLKLVRKNKKLIFQHNKVKINEYIEKSLPIDWICREINVSRTLFKKVFPHYKGSQGSNVEKINFFGCIKTIERKCERCKTPFNITGKLNTKYFYKKRFCSVACAKARDLYWKNNAKQYKTICRQHHKMACIVCGFDKIIDVHHADHNHDNNNPSNLVPLCPNHHRLYHSKFKNEVDLYIKRYLNKNSGM